VDDVREGYGQFIVKGKKISGIFRNGKIQLLYNNEGTLSEFERNSSSIFELGKCV